MSTSIVKMIARRPQKSPLLTGAILHSAQGAQSGRLRVTPDEVRKLSEDLIGLILGIGVPHMAGPPLVIQVDRSAPTCCRLVEQGLRSVPEVESVSGVTADGQAVLQDQYRPMITLYGASVQAGMVLDDSRTVMGAVQRKIWTHIKETVFAARGKGLLTKDEQDLMETAINQLISEENQQKQAPVDRRARTRRANLHHEANVAAMGNHTDLLNTMIDLQTGAPVDEARRAAAAEAYQKLQTEKSATVPAAQKKPRPGPTLH